jgi:cellulose synthase/poly-beta-1,6-N-acetylglucosamine synthase-like glycosyltransferase
MTWETAALWFQQGILVYFAVLNLLYALFAYLGIRSVIVYARGVSRIALRDLLELEFYKPVSILVPAHNEEGSIVASVRSMLGLHHPEFEVVVAQDGSTDRTLEVMVESFSLVEVPLVYRKAIETKPVRRILRSVRYPNLIVVDKENGGKSDAVNAALNVARYPLVCAVDADSLLNAEALLRASRAFVEDDRVVAVGGTVRPLNGAVLRDGTVQELRVPKRWLERFQILEYARGFFTGRAAWSKFGALLIISGAFGVFRRDVILEAGGMWTGTVTEDMELVVRLHRLSSGKRRPYRVLFTPDPICWTEVPSDLGTLRRQRNRWHRGLWETLWRHRGMVFRPRYGSVGLLGLPYFWLFEGLGPVVEVLGYVTLVVSVATGSLFAEFAVLFLALSVLFGMLLSQLAVGIETMLLARYERISDRLRLFVACFLEMFGYRQLMTWERFIATFQVRRKRHAWGAMKRTGILSGPETASSWGGGTEPARESRSEARPL